MYVIQIHTPFVIFLLQNRDPNAALDHVFLISLHCNNAFLRHDSSRYWIIEMKMKDSCFVLMSIMNGEKGFCRTLQIYCVWLNYGRMHKDRDNPLGISGLLCRWLSL